VSRLDLDQVDADAMAEHRRERDWHREPTGRYPRRDDRDLNPRRAFQAGVIDLANRAPHASATIEIPCPACQVVVYTPGDSHGERVDCLDCGAALVARRAIDGTPELEVVDDTAVVDDPQAPAPPLGAGRHLAAFDASDAEPAQTELFPLGRWQQRSLAAIEVNFTKPRSKP